MKTKIVSLFLKREHLILLSKMLQLSENITESDTQILKLDIQNQQSENKILKTERWPQYDLDYFQNNFLQIANLSFSYFKLHFPANSAIHIKDHIKFIQILKQINYGGVTIEDVFKQQRSRLQLEVSKITKSIKTVDEPIMPKIMNYKIDIEQIQTIQDKYFYPRNCDFLNPYLILNLKMTLPKSTARPLNKELYQSITSLEDVPSFQFMNSTLIQPILNYDMLKNSFEYRMNKLMQRNQQISYTIKRYQQSIKNYDSTDDDIQDGQLKEIKKEFCSSIKQIYEKRSKDIVNDQNKKIAPDEPISKRSTPHQTEIFKESDSLLYKPIQEDEQQQQDVVTCTNYNERSQEQLPDLDAESPKLHSLRLTPYDFMEKTYQQTLSQKIVPLDHQHQLTQSPLRAAPKYKCSYKSLDLQQSLILSPSIVKLQQYHFYLRDHYQYLDQQGLCQINIYQQIKQINQKNKLFLQIIRIQKEIKLQLLLQQYFKISQKNLCILKNSSIELIKLTK